MHIKFLKHGRGSASSAAKHLTNKINASGQRHDEIKVLRGDPDMVAIVADILIFKNRYRSAVISFHAQDKPTPDQIERFTSEFEKTAWPGLNPDRYSWTAVLHRIGENIHIHVLTACVDLETGKYLNIAPPGWRKTYDPLRDWFNWEYGWARPDDPNRSKIVEATRLDIHEMRKGLDVSKKPRYKITAYLKNQVINGIVKDRTGIIDALHGIGLKTPRQGQDYITVIDSNGSCMRLKGKLYNAEFQPEDIREKDQAEVSRDTEINQSRADEAFERLQYARRRMSEYNIGRYGAKNIGAIKEIGPNFAFVILES